MLFRGKIGTDMRTELAAMLVMSNNLIDKERLNDLWEEIKMLDILEIAEEKGKILGIREGKSLHSGRENPGNAGSRTENAR